MTVVVKRVTGHAELLGILALHGANLGRNLAAAERAREGFVTAEYTLEFLEQLHRAAPAVIGKDGETVVGYALVALPAAGRGHPLLADLCAVIDRSTYRGVPLATLNYVLCGQLCVAKSHRGSGLVAALYQQFRADMAPACDCLLTDIVRDNPRSLRAHLKAGFDVLGELSYGGRDWDLVICDWRAAPARR